MSKIEGRAKKFDGTAIDYLMIFDWTNGKCLGAVSPDLLGNWQYRYYHYNAEKKIGITYVADGCEPITHGHYVLNTQKPNGLLLHYQFDGNITDSVKDLSGDIFGTVDFGKGRDNRSCAVFNAGAIRTQERISFDSSEITIAFWMQIIEHSSLGIIAELGENRANQKNAFVCAFAGSGTPQTRFSVTVNPENGESVERQSEPVSDAKWHHYAFTYSTTKDALNTINGYLDGEVFGEEVSTASPSGLIPSDYIYIGLRNGSSYQLKAKLQDFKVYNRALTDTEVADLFNE